MLTDLQMYAFPEQEPYSSSSTNRLREVEILNGKIKGLPLMARVLGSTLRNISRDKWTNVLNGVVGNDIMSVLMWSYRRLPWYLKQCFAYLSVFPKDFELEKEHVVWMWMAQGYVQPEGNRTLEDIVEDYFDYLFRASLIQKMQKYGGHYHNMHDLVHDLAMEVSVGGCIPYNHVSIKDNIFSHKYFDNNKLRTLLNLCEDADITKLQLQHVRVLLISWKQHLAQINFDNMIHLRYLDLTKVEADTLPESICAIYNMQTLLLNNRVENFPSGTWNLPNLRHLLAGGRGYPRLEPYEGTMDENQNGILENLRPQQGLRTLEISSYRGDKLPSWMCSNHLPHLVELKLWHLCHVVELPPLGHLPSLEHLVIFGLRSVRCIGDGFYGTEAYVFPSLKVLELRAMDGLEEWEESDRYKKDGISTWFPSLEYLTIWHCEMLRSMPRLNPRCLKHMTINNTELEALPEIIRSSACTDDHPEYCCDIPRLQELSIMDCRSLRPEEWFRRHRMPALQKFRLYEVLDGCTNLVINYSRKCLTYMVIWRMEGLRLIRLSNIAPLDESGEAHYPSLSVELRNLDGLEEMSMVNSEDKKITAGPLQLRADGWYGARRVVENLSKMMLQVEDYSFKNAVKCLVTDGINSRHGLIRVDPIGLMMRCFQNST